MTPALFLTLDNTLVNTLSGRKYSLHREDWKFNVQAVAAIRDFIDRGYRVCLLINQVGISQGFIQEKTFKAKLELILSTLERDLKLYKNQIKYAYCTDEESYDCLPKPGLIYALARKYTIDVPTSILIGNSIYDKDICRYSGIGTFIDVYSLTYDI